MNSDFNETSTYIDEINKFWNYYGKKKTILKSEITHLYRSILAFFCYISKTIWDKKNV